MKKNLIFVILLIFSIFINSQNLFEQFPIKKDVSYEIFVEIPDKHVQGIPIDIVKKDGSIIIPIVKNKNDFNSCIIKQNEEWKKIKGLNPWPKRNFLILKDCILQPQFSKQKIGWGIAIINLKTLEKENFIEVSQFSVNESLLDTHIAITNDGTIYCLAGIVSRSIDFFNREPKYYYEFSMSKDSGQTWSKPKKIFDDYIIHDDFATVFQSNKDELLFFGYKLSNPIKGAISRYRNGEWKEIELPDENTILANFQFDSNVFFLLYAVIEDNQKFYPRRKEREVDKMYKNKISFYLTSTIDFKTWKKPIAIMKGLIPEAPLIKVKPLLLIQDKNFLVAFADIYGNWTRDDFRTILLFSKDEGINWVEIDSPTTFGKKPSYIIGKIIDGEIILLMLTVKKPRVDTKISKLVID